MTYNEPVSDVQVAFSTANAGGSCSIDVTSAATASGQRFTGTYTAVLKSADGLLTRTLTEGVFDGVVP